MNTKNLFGCAALLAVTSFGAEFPDADGSGDLASVAAWGGTLPGTTEAVSVTGAVSTTVHASDSVTFGQLENKLTSGYNRILTFDQTAHPDAVLSFGGFRNGLVKDLKLHTHFKGGIWDFGNKHFASGGSDSYGNERTITVSDGATLSNIDTITLGYTAQNKLRLDILGQSKVSAKNFKFTNNMTTPNTPNVLFVAGGSELELSSGLTWENSPASWTAACSCQPADALYYRDFMIVSNANSVIRFTASNGYWLGHQGGSMTLATDSGKIVGEGSVYLWDLYTRNNLLRAEKNGSIKLSGTVYGGWNSAVEKGDASNLGLRYNRIEAVDGGSIAMGTLYLGYSGAAESPNTGNTLWISNGTFTVGQLVLGYNAGCSNQLVHVLGPESFFGITGASAMFLAPYCEWRIEDGAVVPTLPAFSNMAAGTHDETLRACNGGVINVGEKLSTSTSAAAEGLYSGRNNVVIVESGSSLTGSVAYVQGDACGLRVDDATVALGGNSNNYSLRVGYSNKYGGLATNCWLTIAGSHPQVALTNGLEVLNGSTVKFELPANGYAAGVVPLAFGGNLKFDASTCTLAFSGMDAMSEAHRALGKSMTYVLAENPTGKDFFPDAAVAAAQEQLGNRFILRTRVQDGKNQLLLKARALTGLSIIFR